MKKIYISTSIVLALAVTISACDSTSPLDIKDEVRSEATTQKTFAKDAFVSAASQTKEDTFTICKAAPGDPDQPFTFTTVAALRSPTILSPVVDLADGECQDVATSYEYAEVTTTETVPLGWNEAPELEVWTIVEGGVPELMPHDPGPSITGGIGGTHKAGCLVIFKNKKLPPPPTLLGRITGGGSVFTEDRTRITHGFQLRCDAEDHRQNLEINRGGDNFHLESLTSAVCTDDPLIDERPPTAGFDTYEGVGVGRFNGVSGYNIEFRLTDTGQPGRGDEAEFSITGPDGGIVVSNVLTFGNHQTHRQTGN